MFMTFPLHLCPDRRSALAYSTSVFIYPTRPTRPIPSLLLPPPLPPFRSVQCPRSLCESKRTHPVRIDEKNRSNKCCRWFDLNGNGLFNSPVDVTLFNHFSPSTSTIRHRITWNLLCELMVRSDRSYQLNTNFLQTFSICQMLGIYGHWPCKS